MQLATSNSHQPRWTRSLAAQGDAADIATWSNIPYFFFQASKAQGFLTDALNLKIPQYETIRRTWRIRSMLRLCPPVGYQYSDDFARRMWEMVPIALRSGEIISHMQFFPRIDDAKRFGTSVSYYIDATLRVLWGGKRPAGMSQSYYNEIIAGEAERYHNARFVVTMANATARSIVNEYKIDPLKVFVVRPGANIDEAEVHQFLAGQNSEKWRESEPFSVQHPAVLGFIGNDYKRKGLYRLMEVAEELNRRGRPVLVRAIGNCPTDLRKHPLMDWLGWINKREETQKFLKAVDSFAFGCLLSIAEPLGISTLECLRLGVPVLGTNVGGIPDCVPDDAGLLVAASASGQSIADMLEQVLFDPDRYRAICQNARNQRGQVTWIETVRKMLDIWNSANNNYREQ